MIEVLFYLVSRFLFGAAIILGVLFVFWVLAGLCAAFDYYFGSLGWAILFFIIVATGLGSSLLSE